jgi:hypothetical protein
MGISKELTNKIPRKYTDNSGRRDGCVTKIVSLNTGAQASSGQGHEYCHCYPENEMKKDLERYRGKNHSKKIAYKALLEATLNCMTLTKIAPAPATDMSSKNGPPKARGKINADNRNARVIRTKVP